MFDDQPTGVVPPQGQLPDNLPFLEPDDVFQNTDTVSEAEPPSALEVGVLKPKMEPELSTPTPTPTPTIPSVPTYKTHTMPQDQALQAPAEQSMYTVKDPTLSRGLMTMIIIIIAILIFGGGGWWIYKTFVAPQESDLENNSQNTITAPPVVVPTETSNNLDNPDPTDSGTEINDDQILFGQPLDTDGDGLSDDDEAVRGTDLENWDTDADELSDGDEVIIWDTDPKNRDTDGDTYPDGSEVKSGYSPNGPGRMFEPPAISTSTVVTGTAF